MRSGKMENRVKFKIGEIEFEAEGSAEVVERERSVFLNALLPAAVEAIVRTRGAEKVTQYIEAVEQPTTLLFENTVTPQNDDIVTNPSAIDLSRTSLASFLKNYGKLSEQDFALISAYYDEKKNDVPYFSSENVKKYYAEARRTEPSNVSMLLNQLAQKGLIMDNPSAEHKTPKQYILTDSGMCYIETYKPKDDNFEKKPSKARKVKNKSESIYSSLCADDLNLKNYPEIKSQSTFKKRMLLIMYIVANEGKGDMFSLADIQYLMTDMLGLPATDKQIGGIFDKNRSWFKSEQDPNNKKAYRRKLLQGAKDFVESIIGETTT